MDAFQRYLRRLIREVLLASQSFPDVHVHRELGIASRTVLLCEYCSSASSHRSGLCGVTYSNIVSYGIVINNNEPFLPPNAQKVAVGLEFSLSETMCSLSSERFKTLRLSLSYLSSV